MSDQTGNLMLVYLRRIDQRVDQSGQDMIEVKERFELIHRQSRRLIEVELVAEAA